MKTKLKHKTMWRIIGLEGSPKNDKNLYSSSKQADMYAPVPSCIMKTQIIEVA